MLKIGITGGIGSGKTIICKILEILNVPVYYADIKAKELMIKNENLARNISLILGKNAYTKDHQLNTNYIANKVFTNKGLLSQLNELVHPEVAKDFEEWANMQEGAPYCVKEAALLFESGSHKKMDRTILVVAPEKVRIDRVVNRDQVKEEKVRERIKNQRNQVLNIPIADYIINNDGNRPLIHQVLSIHKLIILENQWRKVLS